MIIIKWFHCCSFFLVSLKDNQLQKVISSRISCQYFWTIHFFYFSSIHINFFEYLIFSIIIPFILYIPKADESLPFLLPIVAL